jgi:S-adenosylhomocysteine hydrolase
MQTYVERLRALGAEIEVHWTRRRSTDDPVAAAVDRQGDALRFALQNCKP